MKDLIKKHNEELSKVFPLIDDKDFDYHADILKTFISKVRKETAEAVADRMIGKEVEKYYQDREDCELHLDESEIGYNHRIKEEKEIKQQILKEIN